METCGNLQHIYECKFESKLLLNVFVNADGTYRENSLGPGEQEHREVRDV